MMGKFCFHWSYLSFSSFFSLERGGMFTMSSSREKYVCLSDCTGMLRELLVSLSRIYVQAT